MTGTTTFYAPTFIDESMTYPDKRGYQTPTGRLSGIVFTRTFFKSKNGKIRAKRGIISFAWDRDTLEAKTAALAKAIEGMEELPDLDTNPPLTWIPEFLRQKEI